MIVSGVSVQVKTVRLEKEEKIGMSGMKETPKKCQGQYDSLIQTVGTGEGGMWRMFIKELAVLREWPI